MLPNILLQLGKHFAQMLQGSFIDILKNLNKKFQLEALSMPVVQSMYPLAL